MQPDNQDSLFDLRLNETGRNYILRIAKIAGGVIVIAILNSAVSMIFTAIRIIKFASNNFSYYPKLFTIADCLIIVVGILNIVAISNYFLFISNLKKSIVKVNEGLYSLSFRFLLRNILFALAVAVVNLLASGLYYFNAFFY